MLSPALTANSCVMIDLTAMHLKLSCSESIANSFEDLYITELWNDGFQVQMYLRTRAEQQARFGGLSVKFVVSVSNYIIFLSSVVSYAYSKGLPFKILTALGCKQFS